MESPAKKAKVSNNSQQQQQQSQKIILSVGAAVIDYLGKLDHYPKQEEKARTQGCDIAFGGNSLNACVTISRLGATARLLTAIGDDFLGGSILDCCKEEKIDSSVIVKRPGEISGFSFVIVVGTTRTCIYNPCKDVNPNDNVSIDKCLEGVCVASFDGKHGLVSADIAKRANSLNISVVLDAEIEAVVEKGSWPRFPELLGCTDFLKCGQSFPSAFTGESDLLKAMSKLMLEGRQKKWIITTLGSQGSLMMRQKRQNNGNGQQESHPIVNYAALQSHIASSDPEELKIQYYSYEQTELLFCPTIQLSNSQIRDTTGAGDVYYGAISYAVAQGFTDEQTLRLGSFVSSEKIKNFSIHGIPREIPSKIMN